MAKNDELEKQCKDLVDEVITFMENGVLALSKMNDELRIEMGVDPNDDLDTAIRKMHEQAAQRYKERRKAEESLSQEEEVVDRDYLINSLPDILLGSSIDSRRREKKGKELGTLYKNSSMGERCSERGEGVSVKKVPPLPIHSHNPRLSSYTESRFLL